MKASKMFALAMFGLSIGSIPMVSATTVTECQSQITALRTELTGVVINGNNPDRVRASLDSKLSNASIKLDQAKFCDSIAKLLDFRDSVVQLGVPNAKGETKISPQDADSLATGASGAMMCVRDLSPSCP